MDTSTKTKLEVKPVKRKKRRKYTQQQKDEAVEIWRGSDKTIPVLARDLGIPENSLRYWIDKAEGNAAQRAQRATGDRPLEATELEELKRLRREVSELRMERDFLKKAAAFFAKESS